MSQDNHTDGLRCVYTVRLLWIAKKRRFRQVKRRFVFRQREYRHKRCADHRRLVVKKANIIHTAAAVLAFMVAIGPRRPNAHLNGKTNLRHAIQNGQDRTDYSAL